MPDATVTALSNTLSAQISGSGATPAAIVALSTGIVNGATTYAAATLARRVGLIVDVNTAGGEDISKLATKFTECMSSDAFLRSSVAADQDLGQLRAALPGFSTAQLNSIGTATLARAALYQSEFGAVLPS